MKQSKIIISGIVLCTLLLLMNCVAAIEKNITVIDETNDVIDLEGNVVTTDPDINVGNIDIKQVKLTASGKDVTIELKVQNQIENRGSLIDLNFGGDELSINAVGYTLALVTSERDYTITYVNQTCNLAYFDDFGNDTSENITTFSVNGNTLTVNFEILSSTEEYDTISALSQFMKFDMADLTTDYNLDAITVLIDEVTDQPLSVVIFEYNDGTVNNPINFSALASGGTPSYSFRWDFGDGSTSNERKPNHAYSTAGEYNVNLTVTDADGSLAYDEVPISILQADNGDSDGSPDITMFFVVIVIIVIIGIAVVVYIIRR